MKKGLDKYDDKVELQRNIDPHIARLRKKIEPQPETPSYVQTVRGFGYKLNNEFHHHYETNFTKIGSLTIDNRCHEVRMENEKIELTPLEYHILHLLASEPGRVWSRDELLEQLWGIENENSQLQTHMSSEINLKVSNDIFESLKIVAKDRNLLVESLITHYIVNGLDKDLLQLRTDHLIEKTEAVLSKYISSQDDISKILHDIRIETENWIQTETLETAS